MRQSVSVSCRWYKRYRGQGDFGSEELSGRGIFATGTLAQRGFSASGDCEEGISGR